MDYFEAKADFRKRFSAARARLGPDARRVASEAAVERLVASNVLDGARVVAAFVAFRSEIDPGALAESALTLVFPRVEGRDLVFARPDDRGLVASKMGILEPAGPAIDKHQIDVFVVPGLAFTPGGDRLGYGGGFYDRYLADTVQPRIGIAFDEQITDALPTQPHDARMDAVVTDKRFFDTRFSR